jgi:hypothetical protein
MTMQAELITRTIPARARTPKRRNITSNRVAVIFSDNAIDWLNEQAQRNNTSVADIIRRVVDETRGAYFVGPKR